MTKIISNTLSNKEMKYIAGGVKCPRCGDNCTCICCICLKQIDVCTCGTVKPDEIN
ncbi:MAG: hypothetical protein LBC84_09495 [Prevotellaceae bacterium]|jgi:hypothetical protein|nr:hypothetical protein [Prevotellaceae bacterium]